MKNLKGLKRLEKAFEVSDMEAIEKPQRPEKAEKAFEVSGMEAFEKPQRPEKARKDL